MDAFPVYHDVLHCLDVTFYCIRDVGKIFPRDYWLELLIQNVGSGFGVTLKKSILVLVVLLQWILAPCSLHRPRTSISCLCSHYSLCLPYMIYLLSWSYTGLLFGDIRTCPVTHIKKRLLEQAVILSNCIPLHMRTSLKGKNLLPEGANSFH